MNKYRNEGRKSKRKTNNHRNTAN